MGQFRRLVTYAVTGLGACSGALLFYNASVGDNKVFAATPHKRKFRHIPSTPLWDSNWDKRDPVSRVEEKGVSETDSSYEDEMAKVVPLASRHIFLIRHGQYNMDGVSDKDRCLTQLGREQAAITGLRLKELNFPYSKLIKSTMTRAQETAEIIAQKLDKSSITKTEDCSLLEEGAPIRPVPAVSHWRPDSSQFYEDGPRIEAAFRRHIHRAEPGQTADSYELIVCHANVIRYFVCRALQFPPEAWLRFTLHHCSITWVQVTPSGMVIVRGLGDSGHIPAHQVTSGSKG